MAETLTVYFTDVDMAEKAVGALLDIGLTAEDISVIATETKVERVGDYLEISRPDPVKEALEGVSTTTAPDAVAGAVTGGEVGLVLGSLAAVASLVIPGFGLVIGGGALATAVGAALGTTAAGALTGGVVGFLKDQGMPEEAARDYHQHLSQGGAVLAVALPPGEMRQAPVRATLSKYNGSLFSSFTPRLPV